eukprot:TRINITY_DN6172_c2_g1_i2.p1 TRINITY_DN6172_c2_g1~~TRINITY_DN6172_c2_g1_i2.p1  ORF type:complete len:502 (+),score=118.25 TRINITY_DN6172_c2_g1_i2:147-1652(+)
MLDIKRGGYHYKQSREGSVPLQKMMGSNRPKVMNDRRGALEMRVKLLEAQMREIRSDLDDSREEEDVMEEEIMQHTPTPKRSRSRKKERRNLNYSKVSPIRVRREDMFPKAKTPRGKKPWCSTPGSGLRDYRESYKYTPRHGTSSGPSPDLFTQLSSYADGEEVFYDEPYYTAPPPPQPIAWLDNVPAVHEVPTPQFEYQQRYLHSPATSPPREVIREMVREAIQEDQDGVPALYDNPSPPEPTKEESPRTQRFYHFQKPQLQPSVSPPRPATPPRQTVQTSVEEVSPPREEVVLKLPLPSPPSPSNSVGTGTEPQHSFMHTQGTGMDGDNMKHTAGVQTDNDNEVSVATVPRVTKPRPNLPDLLPTDFPMDSSMQSALTARSAATYIKSPPHLITGGPRAGGLGSRRGSLGSSTVKSAPTSPRTGSKAPPGHSYSKSPTLASRRHSLSMSASKGPLPPPTKSPPVSPPRSRSQRSVSATRHSSLSSPTKVNPPPPVAPLG